MKEIFALILSRYNHLLIVLCSLIAMILMSSLLGFTQGMFPEQHLLPDSYTYIDAANLLYEKFQPHPIRPIGIAFLMGIPNLFFETISLGQYTTYNLLLNFALWLGSVLMINRSLLVFVGKRTAFLFTLLFIGCIGNLINSFFLLSETLTTFLLSLFAYYLIRYEKSKSHNFLVWAGIIINLSVLVRPGLQYVAFVVSIIIIFKLIRNNIKIFSLYLWLFLSLFTIAVQIGMMKSSYGNNTVSYIDKLAWYYYLGAQSKAEKDTITYDKVKSERKNDFEKITWSEKQKMSSLDLKEQISNNSSLILSNYIQNIYQNSTSGSTLVFYVNPKFKDLQKASNGINYKLYVISKLQNICMVFISVIMMIMILFHKTLRNFSFVIILSLILYTILTSGISFWQGDRFHIVFYPLTLLLLVFVLNKTKVLQSVFKH